MPVSAHFNAELMAPWMNSTLREMAERAYSIRRESYSPYRGTRVSPLPEDLERAFRMSRQGVGISEPNLKAAEELYKESLSPFPETVNRYMNPYQKHVLDKLSEEGVRTFREGIMPQLENTFVQKGQHGSLRHQQLSERAAKQMHSNILEAQREALSRHYQEAAQIHNNEMARKHAAANQMADIGRQRQISRMADMGVLGEQGRYQQAMANEELKHRWEEYLRETNYPQEQLMRQSAVMHGLPYSSMQANMSHAPMQPQSGLPGQIGQVAAGLLQGRR